MKKSLLLLFVFFAFKLHAQEVPTQIQLADIRLHIEPTARRNIQNRVNLMLEDRAGFEQKVKTADLFMPLVSDILKENQLPDDFKYLALLDNIQPDSLIFWQLADDMAQNFGLKINTQTDERQNIITVTKKVAHYLKNNQAELNNWVLTLLSFKLKTQGVKDFLKEYMPSLEPNMIAELKDFPINEKTDPDILQFLANYVAYKNALGLRLKPDIELISYQEGSGKTLKAIAEEFALSEAQLKQFNPWLKNERIPTDKSYDLVIPLSAQSPTSDVNIYTSPNAELVYETTHDFIISNYTSGTSTTNTVHIVEKGQTLYAISKMYGLSVDEIKKINALDKNAVLSVGQKILVGIQESVNNPKEEKIVQTTMIHTVEKGEGLYKISKTYNVSVTDIKSWNNLSTDALYLGQKLKINQPMKVDKPTWTPPTQENQGKIEKPQTIPKKQGKRTVSVKTVPVTMTVAGVQLNISAEARKLIQKEVDLMTKNDLYFLDKVYRADVYIDLIEKVLQEEGLPTDFKYLPIQESSLVANAVSRSNAVGYWQFKEESAVEVGISVNKQIDERMNIIASSRGACKYLKRNNLYYNNWIFTLLSHNMGFTGAKNYLERKYPDRNLKNLKNLDIDKDIHWYIVKFLAHKILFENEISIDKPAVKLKEHTQGSDKTLKQIAEEQNADYNDMLLHNQWLKKNKVPDDKTYSVIVSEKVE
jgi:LysM repeat protein